ncbi:MAG: phasin family protein [Pseudomonadota bacterium]
MAYIPEQFIATNKASVQKLEGLTNQGYDKFEQLVKLNLTTSKSVWVDTFRHTQAVFGTKGKQELPAFSDLLESLVEKSASYAQHLFALASDSNAELNKSFDALLVEAKTTFNAVLANLEKNAPGGAENAVVAFANAVKASQDLIESAQNSAKKAVKLAQSNSTTRPVKPR